MLKKFIYVFLSLCLVHPYMLLAAGSGHNVTGHTHRFQKIIDRARFSLEASERQITLILEDKKLDSGKRSLIASHRGTLRYSIGNHHEISLPASRLSQFLSALPADTYARLPYPHQTTTVSSEGAALTGALDMQVLGTTGMGVKIGIIDMGFGGFAGSQASGDLPISLTATDYTGTGTGGTTHGTNVAEIVYAMAPGADLYLAKINTDVQLAQATTDMINAGVQVINHSVVWYAAAFYDGTGPLCDIADNAEANSVQWVNSMGNSRGKHYLGVFNDTDSDLRHEFATGQNFNTVDLIAGTGITLILNWDAYPTTSIDYNLELYNGDPDSGGVRVASSQVRQTGNASSYPYEVISYTPAVTGTHYIVVTKQRSSTANIPLTLFSLERNLGTRTLASSIVQPADCISVLGIGATNLTDNPESFSSEGPTTDGRAKPEISGPDRVQTSITSSFAGTSAASPHVAGAAALLLADSPLLTTTQLRGQLTIDPFDVSVSGFDYRTGYGRISLDADLDGFNHDADNCPLIVNTDQLDTDGDGLGDVCDDDIDGDGLTNDQEAALGTDPLNPDTDSDGLTDADETNIYFTDPLNPDTDSDGLTDADEVLIYGTNPSVSDKGDLAPFGIPDGQINLADLMVQFRIINGLVIPGARELALGDMNNDGTIDIVDSLILSKLLGFQ